VRTKVTLGEHRHYTSKKLKRVDPTVGRIGVGKLLTDIIESCRTKKSIADGMEKNITIGVGYGSGVGGVDRYSAESHRATGFEAMDVVTVSD
jgi:hypothetical protein